MSKKPYGLTDTMDTLYEKYMLQNPASSTSKSQFYKKCPLQVRLTHLTQQRQCLCQRHVIMALRLMVIKSLPTSRDIVLAMSDGEVYRVVQELPDVNTTFQKWMRTDVQFNVKTIKTVKLIEVISSKDLFSQEFTCDLANLREHSRRVQAHYAEMRRLRPVVKLLQECTIQMDYAENYACCYANEVSSVCYGKHQVIIQPVITHYRDGNGAFQHQSIVGITEQKGHTMARTAAFLQTLQPPLKAILPEFSHVHYMTVHAMVPSGGHIYMR